MYLLTTVLLVNAILASFQLSAASFEFLPYRRVYCNRSIISLVRLDRFDLKSPSEIVK